MDWVQSVDDKAVLVFVCDANAHHFKWLESVSPTDRHGHDQLINLTKTLKPVHYLHQQAEAMTNLRQGILSLLTFNLSLLASQT